jgi:hypothetical protein
VEKPLALKHQVRNLSATGIDLSGPRLSFLGRFLLGGFLRWWSLAPATTTAGIARVRSKEHC